MYLADHAQGYGLISIVLHWSMAIVFIELFILEKYMVDLDYYSRWYQTTPDFHRSIGVLVSLLMLLLLMLFRWGRRRYNRHPDMRGKRWEKILLPGNFPKPLSPAQSGKTW